jgi:hypothetical protein
LPQNHLGHRVSFSKSIGNCLDSDSSHTYANAEVEHPDGVAMLGLCPLGRRVSPREEYTVYTHTHRTDLIFAVMEKRSTPYPKCSLMVIGEQFRQRSREDGFFPVSPGKL